MRKIISLILALMTVLMAAGCKKSDSNSAAANTASYDVDLVGLSSTMVYSEVYNMMSAPGNYIGKTVRMCGNFGVSYNQSTGKYYFLCIIPDATACCSQGIEFVLAGEHTYPDDYPELDSTITVVGTFVTYQENGYLYCQLINAVLE